MKWATRQVCHVDRSATGWLVKTFIDTEATFIFVGDPDDVPHDATPFDMRGVTLSHHGNDCTFETVLKHYELDDPTLWEVAAIVHEADLADEAYHAPEAAGLDVICRGLSLIADDARVLAITRAIFDGLYQYKRQSILGRRDST